MKTIEEIEDAIEKLPAPDVEALADWLEALRSKRTTAPLVERWLQQARGAANPDVTTAGIISLTRGDE